jgi:ABC-2 type transport system permease protein
MLNLVRKDLALQKKTLMILLPLLFVYMFIDISPIWVGALFSITLITTTFAMDDKSSIHLFLNALPYTRKEIVASKYIGAVVFTLLVLLTITTGNLLIRREWVQWEQLLFIALIVALVISFAFPFSYLFKSQYLMAFFTALIVLYFVIVNLFIPDMNDRIRALVQSALSLDQTYLYMAVIAAVSLLYAASWMLSTAIYRRKVF